MSGSNFLVYLDATADVHMAIAFNMVKAIAPFKKASQTIEIPSELHAEKAQSIIQLHSGQVILAQDSFQDLVTAMQYGDFLIPISAGERDYETGYWVWSFKMEIAAPSKLVVAGGSPVVTLDDAVDPNALRSH